MKAPQKDRDLERPWECRSSAWVEKNVLKGGTFGAFAIGLRGEPACILGRRNKLKMEMPRLRICTKYLWFRAQSLKLWPIFNSLEFASIWQLDSTPSNFRPNMERLNEAKNLYEMHFSGMKCYHCFQWLTPSLQAIRSVTMRAKIVFCKRIATFYVLLPEMSQPPSVPQSSFHTILSLDPIIERISSENQPPENNQSQF